MGCLVGFCDSGFPAMKQRLLKCCPCVYQVFWGDESHYTIVKTVLGFLFGGLLGVGLYFGVISHISSISVEERELFGAGVTLLIAVGFALSRQLRCIMILVIPVFFGRHGRTLLASLIFVLLLAGPVDNIRINAQESARAIECVSSLTFNHSKELYLLLNKPYSDAFKDAKAREEEVRRGAKEIQREFVEFEDEVEGSEESEGKKRKFSNPITADELVDLYKYRQTVRCYDLFTKGVENCKENSDEMHQACLKEVGGLLQRLFCFPLKFASMCNIISLFNYACNHVPPPPDDLGDMYLTLQAGIHSMDTNFDVALKWKMTKWDPLTINGTSVTELRAQMEYEIRKRKQWFQAFYTLAKIVLSFAFILVFKSASSYNSKYLKDVKFDNFYITSYFRKVDARRKKQKKRTVLPQKKAEKNDIIAATHWKLRKKEQKSMILGLTKLLTKVIVAVVLIFFDNLLYEMLDMIERHSHVDYTLQGEHVMRIVVMGNGIIAKLFKKVLAAFDQSHSVDAVATNKLCLPHPNPPNKDTSVMVSSLLGAMLVLLYFQAYGMRLRRVICAYYYPKKEKQRILYLYNEMLKKRTGFLKYVRLEVRRLARERGLEKKVGTLATLRYSYPRLCGFLALLKLGRRRCIICEDYDNKHFQECPTEGCDFIYCKQCWRDIEKQCYACREFDSKTDEFFSD